MEMKFSTDEIQLHLAYSLLIPQSRPDLESYLNYLLNKQYKIELFTAIAENGLFWKMLHNIVRIVERNEFDFITIKRKIKQLKELYFGIYSDTHAKYSEVIHELDCYDLFRDFGTLGFENIERALQLENKSLLQIEIKDFNEGFKALVQKKVKHKSRLIAI